MMYINVETPWVVHRMMYNINVVIFRQVIFMFLPLFKYSLEEKERLLGRS